MAQDFDINGAQLAELGKYLSGEREFSQEQLAMAGGAVPPPIDTGAVGQQQPGVIQLPKEIVDAYNSGVMDPAAEAELEADVASGEVVLPAGAGLARKVSEKVAQEYASGTLPAERVAQLEEALSQGRARLPAGFSRPKETTGQRTATQAELAAAQPTAGLQGALAASAGGPAGPMDKKEELGVIGSAVDYVTGESRKTTESESLPNWNYMPETAPAKNPTFDTAKVFAGTQLADPKEIVDIIKSNFPGVGVRQDAAGNFILKSSIDGKEYAIQPGFRVEDIPRALTGIGVGVAGGLGGTVLKSAGSAAAATSAVEASQALTGGSFDVENVAADAAFGAAAIPAAKLATQATEKVRTALGRPARDIAAAPAAPSPDAAKNALLSAGSAIAVKNSPKNRRDFIIAMGDLDTSGVAVPDNIKKTYGVDIWGDIPPEVLMKDADRRYIMDAFASQSAEIRGRRADFADKVSDIVDRNINAVATDAPVTNPIVDKTKITDRSDTQRTVVERLRDEDRASFGHKSDEKDPRTGRSGYVPGRINKAYAEVFEGMADRGAASTLKNTREALEDLARLPDGAFDAKYYRETLDEMPEVAKWVQQAEYAEKGLSSSGTAKKKGVRFEEPMAITAERIQQKLRSAIDDAIARTGDGKLKADLEAVKKAAEDDMFDLIESQGGDLDKLLKANADYEESSKVRKAARELIGDALTDEGLNAKEAMGPIDQAFKGLAKGEAGKFSKFMKLLGPDARTAIASSLDTVFSRKGPDSARNLATVSNYMTGVASNELSSRAFREHLTPEYAKLFNGVKKLVDWGADAQKTTASSGAMYNVQARLVESRPFATKARLAVNSAVNGLVTVISAKLGGMVGGTVGSGAGAAIGSAAAGTARDTALGPQSTSYAMARLGEVLQSPEFMADLREMVIAQSVTPSSAARAIKEGRAPGMTRDQLIEQWRQESLGRVGKLRDKLTKLPAMKELAKAVNVDLNKRGEYEAFIQDFVRAAGLMEDNARTEE